MEKKTAEEKDDGVRGRGKRTFSCEPLGTSESYIFSFRGKEHVRPEASATLVWRKKKSTAAGKRPGFLWRPRSSAVKKTAAVVVIAVFRLAFLLALSASKSPRNDGRDREACRLRGREQGAQEKARFFGSRPERASEKEKKLLSRRAAPPPARPPAFFFSKHPDPSLRRLRLGGRFTTPRAGRREGYSCIERARRVEE